MVDLEEGDKKAPKFAPEPCDEGDFWNEKKSRTDMGEVGAGGLDGAAGLEGGGVAGLEDLEVPEVRMCLGCLSDGESAATRRGWTGRWGMEGMVE